MSTHTSHRTLPSDKVGGRLRPKHTPKREDALPVRRQSPLKCPKCGQFKADDDRSHTERVLAISDHPLVVHLRFHDVHGENAGAPAESDQFLAWLDSSKTPRAEHRDAAILLARAFAASYPVLGVLVAQSVFDARSDRELARELGLDHHTVARMLARGQELLKQLAAERNLYT